MGRHAAHTLLRYARVADQHHGPAAFRRQRFPQLELVRLPRRIRDGKANGLLDRRDPGGYFSGMVVWTRRESGARLTLAGCCSIFWGIVRRSKNQGWRTM